jgi:hypothetical protein
VKNAGIKLERVEARLEIDIPTAGNASTTLPLSKLSVSIKKNAIPQASCSLAGGVWVQYTTYVSNLHFILNNLDYRVKARAYAKITPIFFEKDPTIDVSDDPLVNGKEFLLFDGYASGAGYRRSGTNVEFVISLEHFLSDLAGSSCISPDIHPGIPINSTFPAIGNTVGNPSGTLGTNAMFFSQPINPEAAVQDIWKDGMFIAFKRLAEINALSPASAITSGFNVTIPEQSEQQLYTATENKAALEVLGRFHHAGPYYQPLRTRGTESNTRYIQHIIRGLRSKTLLHVDNGTTLWDQIMQSGADLMYDVIPLIDKVLVVPKFANNKTAFKTIYNSEIESFDISTGMPRFTKAVVLKSVVNTSDSSTEPLSQTVMTMGIYSTNRREGMVLIQQAPSWTSAFSKFTTDNPPAILPNTKGIDPDALRIAKQTALRAEILNNYAKCVYSNEVLKYRGGVVVGKLRFDIAPGSVVKLDTNSLAGPSLNSEYDLPVFGCVDQVNITLDADGPSATTAFTLSSVRNEKENEDDSIAFAENPFYDNTWNGSPLLIGE